MREDEVRQPSAYKGIRDPINVAQVFPGAAKRKDVGSGSMNDLRCIGGAEPVIAFLAKAGEPFRPVGCIGPTVEGASIRGRVRAFYRARIGQALRKCVVCQDGQPEAELMLIDRLERTIAART